MKCPSCGAETKGKYCEYCGSEMPKETPTINITNNYYVQPEKKSVGVDSPQSTSTKNTKKKTWLWVLGWICIFPLPLTILLLRKKDMKPAIKHGVIAVAWVLFFVIGMSGGGGEESTKPSIDSPSQTESIGGNQTIDNTTTTEETDTTATEDAKPSYAEDTVVNRFISEFNEKSAYDITDISKGNIRTKYFGYANGRYLEMINANGAGAKAFSLTINGGQKAADKQSMYEVFREAVKILDPSITDAMIDAALKEFDDKDVLIEGYALGDSITITYVPIKELSYGKTSCRIDIYASNYK